MMLGRAGFIGVAVALAALMGCASKDPPAKKSASGTKKDDTNVPAEGDGNKGSNSNVPPPSSGSTDTNAPSSPVSPTSPKLDSMDPTSVPESASEGATVDITLSGSQFANNAQVSIGDQSVKPTTASGTSIKVRVPAVVLSKAGSVPVKILNPPSSGGASNSLSFTVTSAAAHISLSNIDPSTVEAGATSSLSLNVTGSGFTMNSRVRFNGNDVKTIFGSSSSLTATVPSTMLKLAGRVSVTVFDGSTVSSPKTFTINKAAVVNACAYSCADYGYTAGQCYQDWACGNDGCLQQQACAAGGGGGAGQYRCADYGYAEGQCYQDWTCTNGYLVAQACGGGGGGGGGGGAVCDYYCADYNYQPGECADGWCCDDPCLVDESVYFP
jgi:hypothetical protein